jgi:Peptidase propeptide and YPEB domain
MRPRLIPLALALPIALAATLLLPQSAGAKEQKVTQTEAIEIAKQDPKAIAALREHPNLTPSASRNEGTGLWEVGFFSGGDEVVQVVIDPVTGNILESWTGYQVA